MRLFVTPPSLRLTPLFLAIIFVSGCVLPPEQVEPRTISRQELEIVSIVKRGNDYAMAGRLDMAERQYREALRLSPDAPVILNDLGYVLLGQNRTREAKEFFLQALQLDPDYIVARDNLARLLYREGELLDALREYTALVDNLLKQPDGGATSQEQAAYRKRLTSALRNSAILNFVAGYPGEGICHARLALAQRDESYSMTEHARLLLSFERHDLALPFLRDQIVERGDQTPAMTYFDYGLALYSSGDIALAKQAFQRISAATDAETADRLRSRIFRMLVAKKLGEQEELNRLTEVSKAEGLTTCQLEDLGDVSYWPQPVMDDVKSLLNGLCADESDSLFSS